MIRPALLFFPGAAALVILPSSLLAQSVPILDAVPPATPTVHAAGIARTARPTIIVGDPSIAPNPTAFSAINLNLPGSPLAGVVSVYGALSSTTGVIGSGVVLDSTHILTAAHVVDFLGGITPEGDSTGDGIPDALIPNSRIYLNNIAAPDPYTVSAISLAPGWNGFRNANGPLGLFGASTHNDLAILTLAQPLPAGVPSYPIYRFPFDQDTGKILLFSGYGIGGDASVGITAPATYEIKRYGWNLTVLYEGNELTGLGAEIYFADFDQPGPDGGPSLLHGGIDGYTTVGNGAESIIAPGDSGGPAFLIDDRNNDGFVQTDELLIFGLTTFTFDTDDGAWPFFGAAFGGPILSSYTGFVDAHVPEPASLTLLAAGALLLKKRRRWSLR